MRKKTLLQIILIIFLVILTYIIFTNYYIGDKTKSSSTKNNNNISNSKSEKSDKNLIKDISYTANNIKGDIYHLWADFGEIYVENQELMFLTDVNGKITLHDGIIVTIKSDYANYNTKTFETTFINNVKVKKSDEIITGDELYLALEHDDTTSQDMEKKEENILRMSRNVFYKKPGYTLSADILEIDLITKNIKIYMIDKYKKVLAQKKFK